MFILLVEILLLILEQSNWYYTVHDCIALQSFVVLNSDFTLI